MSRVAGRSRPFTLALIVGISAVGVLPVPTAAGPAFTFTVGLQTRCVSGTGPASAEIEVTLFARDGSVRDTATTTSAGNGTWSIPGCFWHDVNATDKIRAESGASSRTFTVPKLTVAIDRVTDVVSGRAPTNGALKLFSLLCSQDYDDCPPGPSPNAAVAANGTYSRDFTSQANLRGKDYLTARWTSPSGDTVSTRSLRVPYVGALIDSHEVYGDANAPSEVTATLKSAGGSVIGSGHDVATPRQRTFFLELLDTSGRPAYVRPGMKVKANVASDASMTVPVTAMTGDTGANSVSGRCFANAPVYVYLEHQDGSYDWTEGYTTTGADGRFSMAVAGTTQPGFVLESGDRYQISCLNGKGDEITRYGTI